MRKILLMGNPNVGKSAVFSRLTGVNVIASNYPGTTVEFTKGYMFIEGEKVEVIDVPGVYGIKAASRAEEVALNMLEEGDIILNIVDSTKLERNLNLTLSLIKTGKPMLIVLNMWDEIKHRGIKIDRDAFEKILGVPAVSVCALTGEGINVLHGRVNESAVSSFDGGKEDRWKEIGKIIEKVQTLSHRHHTLMETLGDASVNPYTGFPIALLTGFVSFKIIRFIGEGLIGNFFEPLFEKLWLPLIMKLSALIGVETLAGKIIVGKLIDGEVDFVQSMGLLTTGLFVPIAMVLPYVFAFYLILSFLEDSGYLPRLGILLDGFMHKIGLHGLAIIPMILGLGCNVPAALSTRILETRRERFIAATLMAIAVPCMAQIAMIVGLAGKFGAGALALIFGTLFAVWLILGVLQNLLIKGDSPEIFVEIPPYRLPYFNALLKKVLMRIRWFLSEALPFVMAGVLVVNFLYALGIISFIGKIFRPVITGVMGLPEEAAAALVIGFLRKDVAVGMLAPLGLSMKQLVIASVALTMYFPCVATFAVLIKELGWKDMLLSTAVMIVSTVFVSGLLNIIL
ncbi:MAG: ferrous iron transporter B [Elusimicrobiota bacterium]|nr:ferrous iron transporter B [Elusimicrobiota bacterium]